MNTLAPSSTRKRSVNLTLRVDVVDQVRSISDNLSATVESLLVAYIDQQKQTPTLRQKVAMQSTQTWNDFNRDVGSFADEYVTL
ncbi:MAG: type II toxin-antitoxin system CcdA family antitoxin [Rhodoferax sp.]|nr:type II toxin-antitoxin system CcdA family antitoxin [Rhodoferax sp.]